MAVIGNSQLSKLVMLKDLIMGMGDAEQIGPASIDLRLGKSFALINMPERKSIVLGDKVDYIHLTMDDEDDIFYLKPGEFVLATTMETVNIPNDCCGFVQGRSSIGRIGLTTQNAGFVDPGFHGQITLELVNESQKIIGLKPGYRVAQLVLMDVKDITSTYDGKYNGQTGATGSRMQEDKEAR